MDSTTHRPGTDIGCHLRLVSNRDIATTPAFERTLPDGAVVQHIPIRVPGAGGWQVIWVTARRRRLRVTVQVVSEHTVPLPGTERGSDGGATW